MPEFAQSADGLQPAENLLDQLPLLLADGVAGMTRGPIIDGAALDLLRDVRRDTQRAYAGDEAGNIEPFVSTDGCGVRASASNSNAASRSAVPVAAVTHTFATKP